MGKTVLLDAFVEINSVDLSDRARSVSLSLSAAEIEDTCMGDASVGRLAGLKDVAISVTFANDFAASEVEASMWAIYNAGVAVPIKIRNNATAAISATNPEYQFNAIMTNWPVLDGAVGDLSEVTIDFMGDGDVTRDVTP